jgi:hypothetical protein
MSRSYKKTPWCGNHKGKDKKRCANKVVRMWLKEHPDIALKCGQYKKLYERWDICDYGWITTWEEYWEHSVRLHEEWLRRGWKSEEPDKKEEYRRWLKWHKSK